MTLLHQLPRLMLAGTICLLALSWHAPPQAQETGGPLTAAFVPVPPFAQQGPDGARSGFLIELTELIGAETGIAIRYLDLKTSREFIRRQIDGGTQIIAGVARLPPLEASNVFSSPVASETLRLTVLSRRAAALAGRRSGLRIGIVPPAAGSAVQDLLTANSPVEFATPEAAVMNLLTGGVDAVLMPEPVVFSIARNAQVDARISFLDPPVRAFGRYVALHKSRADLLPAVNAALARMEADGRLPALRQKYFLDIPEPAPGELTAGVYHNPPYQTVEPGGRFSGFAVEVLRGLADRAGLMLEFKQISIAERQAGPGPGRYDLLPELRITGERRGMMDFTLPLEQVPVSLFTRTGETEDIAGLEGLSLRRVAALRGSPAHEFAADRQGMLLLAEDTADAVLDSLLQGRADAILAPAAATRASARKRGAEDRIEAAGLPVLSVARAPALRFGLGSVRDRLNAVIPGYLASSEFAWLREKYFGPSAFWTRPRRLAAAAAAGVVILALAGFLFWQHQRQRQRAYERQARELELEQTHGRQLSAMVNRLETTSRQLAEFTYAMSHDLKAPAQTIRALLAELRATSGRRLDGDGQEILDDLDRTNARMARLVEDLRVYARSVDEKRPAVPVDLNREAEAAAADAAAEIAAAGSVIKTAPLPAVDGNPEQLRTLFRQLISNAVAYRDPARGSMIEIGRGPAAPAGWVSFTVRDNGIGIEPEYHDRIFGLFKRLHRHSDHQGSGIGLTLCRRIAANHGGSIEVESRKGAGSAFTVTLPEKADIRSHEIQRLGNGD
ncbi:transporter substrate-binding domain-containing protein [Leisingera caerulea]|uniref:transporter substrate-binding domain-containing protein n=1 Tax=Leisingera caerulea TaxID=506591 RepID=UPI0021A51B71|nr:transporter substrate-binding domain-containing protein [Leisingera caerulea]UWQ62169.1 transporter substrate-binding domain-containing protein [Leisingera caerulea]